LLCQNQKGSRYALKFEGPKASHLGKHDDEDNDINFGTPEEERGPNSAPRALEQPEIPILLGVLGAAELRVRERRTGQVQGKHAEAAAGKELRGRSGPKQAEGERAVEAVCVHVREPGPGRGAER